MDASLALALIGKISMGILFETGRVNSITFFPARVIAVDNLRRETWLQFATTPSFSIDLSQRSNI
jgi:hypothetical protein